MRGHWARHTRSWRTASTRPTCSGGGCGSEAQTRASSSCRSAWTSTAFRPTGAPPDVDVISVGADPHRDFELLLTVARAMPETSFLAVTTADRARSLAGRSSNVAVEIDLPFDEMRRRLERARVVALPVRENSYSGATTVLLQAMAVARPVVVTRTAAIAAGYGLESGENVQLVAPGDAASFGRALTNVLQDEVLARSLGAHARVTVESEFTWDRYVARLGDLLEAARG